jgi:hypothetical protein
MHYNLYCSSKEGSNSTAGNREDTSIKKNTNRGCIMAKNVFWKIFCGQLSTRLLGAYVQTEISYALLLWTLQHVSELSNAILNDLGLCPVPTTLHGDTNLLSLAHTFLLRNRLYTGNTEISLLCGFDNANLGLCLRNAELQKVVVH